MNQYLAHYQVAVQHPGVSGFEVLELLMVRDRLLGQAASLTPAEKEMLAQADRQLLINAPAFLAELTQVTGLEYERQQRQPAPTQWWWYLDVLVQAPTAAPEFAEVLRTPA